jgi:hypothetical protein
MQDVEVRHSVVMQGSEKVERKKAVLSGEHHPGVNTVLDKHCSQVDQVVLRNLFKALLELLLKEFLYQNCISFAFFILFLKIFLVFLEFIVISLIHLARSLHLVNLFLKFLYLLNVRIIWDD